MTGLWASKAYSFFDTLLWIACLNLLWFIFTLAGLGIFGAGPSTVAAHELVRRRVRGDVAKLPRAFWDGFRKNFFRGNALGLVTIVVGTMLVANWKFFSGGMTFMAQFASGVIGLLAVIFAATVCYLFPMYVRYDLPVLRYLMQSSRFALRYLVSTALLLLVTGAVVYASLRLPGLIPFFSVGVWIYVVGWLCDKFFTANDLAISEAGQDAGGTALLIPTNSARLNRSSLVKTDREKVAHRG